MDRVLTVPGTPSTKLHETTLKKTFRAKPSLIIHHSSFIVPPITIYQIMIYLDNNATTRVAPEVFAAMQPYLTEIYGNPSSAHSLGRQMKAAVERAREQVAELSGRLPNQARLSSLPAVPNLTTGRSAACSNRIRTRRHIITTRVEHEAVRNLCDATGGEWLRSNLAGSRRKW